MSKKIFHIFDSFLDFFLHAIWLKSFVKFLRKYKSFFLSLLGLFFLTLVLYFSTWSQEDFLNYKKNLLTLSETHKLLSYFIFFTVYFIFALLGLPGTVFLGAVGGFIFGFPGAFVFSLLAVVLGSCCAFLVIRFLLRDFFIKSLKKSKKAVRLNKVYSRLKENEVYYLIMFRLFPFAPLAITNIVMGLGKMRFKVFSFVCFLTIIPYLLIYVTFGSKLSQLESWDGLYDPILIISFSLVAVLPLLTKYLFYFLKKIKKKEFELEEALNTEEFIVSQN